MTNNTTDSGNQTILFICILGCYFTLHILLRITVSGSLDYDEAEQALLAQWLLAGYTEQPPLYSWIQHYLFKLFGENVFSVSLLKNCLLYFTYVFVFLAGRSILKSNRAAILATCSLLLIPQIGWESQRDMTHTTLVVFAAAGTLYQTLRLMDKRTLTGYLILGLFLGTGFMAKANFALFIVTLFLTLCTLHQGRRVLFNSRILVSLLVLFAMSGNYFLWMYSNQDIVFSATGKFKRAVDDYHIKGTLSLIRNSFLFLTPLWLFYLIFFPNGYDVKWWEERTVEQKFIGRYIAFVFVVLLFVVLLFKVTYVKDRWMQPLLFAAPLFFFSRVEREKLTLKRTRSFLILTAVAAVIIYSAFTIRVVGASYIQRFCRMNYPFTTMAEDLRSAGFENGLIISNNRFLAGNMHFQFPESPAIIPGYHFEKLEEAQSQQQGVVIWRAEESRAIPEKLGAFLKEKYQLQPTRGKIHFYEHTYKYGRTETITLAVMYVDLTQMQDKS